MNIPPHSDTHSGGDYCTYWEQFYRQLQGDDERRPLWDVPPERAAARDMACFGEYFDASLPLLDIGCGTGTQTAYLAHHYSPVLGLDISATAISMASRCTPAEGLAYEQFLPSEAFVRVLRQRFGDCNVYLRGVLHQLQEDDLPFYQWALAQLLGERGTLYFIEVADGIRDYLQSGAGGFSGLPGPIKRTLISHFPPRGLNLDGLEAYFPVGQFSLAKAGVSELETSLKFEGGHAMSIPAIYGVARTLWSKNEH